MPKASNLLLPFQLYVAASWVNNYILMFTVIYYHEVTSSKAEMNAFTEDTLA